MNPVLSCPFLRTILVFADIALSYFAELTAAMNTGLQKDVQTLQKNLNCIERTVNAVKADVQGVGVVVGKLNHSLERHPGILEECANRDLRPHKLLKEMTIGVTETLKMYVPEHFVSIDDRVKDVVDMLQEPTTKVLALIGMGGVGKDKMLRWESEKLR